MNAVQRSLKLAAVLGLAILASQIPTGRAQAFHQPCVDWCYIQRDECMQQCQQYPYPDCETNCRRQLFQCISACS